MDDLPAYQPPLFPLTNNAYRSLAEISSSRANDTAGLRRHLSKAAQLLGGTIADLNDAVAESRYRLRLVSRSRLVQEGDPMMVMARDGFAAHVGRLEPETKDLNVDMEQSARELIDWTAAVEDEDLVMEAVRDELVHQAIAGGASQDRRTRRGGRRDDDEHGTEEEQQQQQQQQQDDETDDPPAITTMEMIRERCEQKKAEYDAMTAYQRYALNNNYISFKKQQYQSLYGDYEPLPDAKKWFTAEGRPVLGLKNKTRRVAELDDGLDGGGGEDGGNDNDDDDDDDDIVIQSEKISLRCPLSLKDMEEPYSSTKCHHTFEKDSIVAFIGNKRQVCCPQAGCNMMLGLSDFHLDEAILRRIKRAKEAERRRPREDDYDDDDDGHEHSENSIAVSGERTVNMKQRCQPVVDDDQDE